MPAPYNPPWGRGSSGQRPTPDPNIRVGSGVFPIPTRAPPGQAGGMNTTAEASTQTIDQSRPQPLRRPTSDRMIAPTSPVFGETNRVSARGVGCSPKWSSSVSG